MAKTTASVTLPPIVREVMRKRARRPVNNRPLPNRPWPKGHTANPNPHNNGADKRILSTACDWILRIPVNLNSKARESISKKLKSNEFPTVLTVAELIVLGTAGKAAQGDISAVRELWDRTEGKVVQPMELRGEIDVSAAARELYGIIDLPALPGEGT